MAVIVQPQDDDPGLSPIQVYLSNPDEQNFDLMKLQKNQAKDPYD